MKAEKGNQSEARQDQANDRSKPSPETTSSIDITTEQRTEIRNVIAESRPRPVDIEIDVGIGGVVPRTVTLEPRPPRVVEIVPASL